MYRPKRYADPFNRYIIGSAIIVILTFAGGFGFIFFGAFLGYDLISWHPLLGHNVVLFATLIPFAFGLIGLIAVIKFIHKRGFGTLIANRYKQSFVNGNTFPVNTNRTSNDKESSVTSTTKVRPKIDYSKIWFSFFLAAGLIILFYLIELLIRPQLFDWNFQTTPFLFLILIAILFIPIQAGLEELIFRGYLMQGFERLLNKRWFPLIMTSLIFAGLHLPNPEIQTFGYGFIGTYFFFGIIAGIISYLDDGIELVMGLHIANNMITLLFISPNWAVIQTDALYASDYQPKLIEFYLNMLLIYGIYFLVLVRKYRWKNWKTRLLGTTKDVFSK